MIRRIIKGFTNVLGKPPNWDENIPDAECSDLHIRASKFADNVWLYESAWEPTPEELRVLNEGGSVVLGIVGSQPPVRLGVEEQ